MKSWIGLILAAIIPFIPTPSVANELTLNTYLRPPFSTADGTGYFDKILFEMARRTDLRITIRNLPIKRGLTVSNQGLDDGHFPRVQSVATSHDQLLLLPVPLYRSTFVAITKENTPQVKSWSDLNSLRVGFPLGWKMYTDLKDQYGTAIPARNGTELISLLTRGTVEVLLSEVTYFAEIAEVENFHEYFVHYPALATDDVYVLLHLRHRDKLDPLTLTLTDMTNDGTIATLCPPCGRTLGLHAPTAD